MAPLGSVEGPALRVYGPVGTGVSGETVMAEIAGAGRQEVGMTEYVDAVNGAALSRRLRRAVTTSAPRETHAPKRTVAALPARARRVSWNVAYRRRAIAGDAVVAAVTGATTALVAMPDATPLARVLVVVALPVLWLGVLSLSHGYERRFAGSGPEEYRAVMRSAVYLVGAAAFLSYAAHVDVPRLTSLVAVTMLFALGLYSRQVVRRDLYRRRSAGIETQATVIIGNAKSVLPMIREIKRAPEQGLHVVAACVSGLDLGGDTPSRWRECPSLAIRRKPCRPSTFFAPMSSPCPVTRLLHGPGAAQVWPGPWRSVTSSWSLSPGLLGVAGPRLSIRPTAGMPLLHIEHPVMSGGRRLIKSVVDKAFTVLLLVMALPALLAIAVAIRLDSPGPVLFRQTRVGRPRRRVPGCSSSGPCVVDAERGSPSC